MWQKGQLSNKLTEAFCHGKGEARYICGNNSDLIYTRVTLVEWLSYHVKPLRC